MRLSEHTCIPCQGGFSPLSLKERELFLRQLQGNWHLNDQDHLEKKRIF